MWSDLRRLWSPLTLVVHLIGRLATDVDVKEVNGGSKLSNSIRTKPVSTHSRCQTSCQYVQSTGRRNGEVPGRTWRSMGRKVGP